MGSNSKTVQYVEPNITTEPLFILADPRGNGTQEWFAVVTNNSKAQITAYAQSAGSAASAYFTREGETSPVQFNNIITTLMTNMSELFKNVTTFNKYISSWDTSNVTIMAGMFYNATAFNQNIGLWNTAKVTGMAYMFFSASAFNQNLSGWNVGKVTPSSNRINFATGSPLALPENYTKLPPFLSDLSRAANGVTIQYTGTAQAVIDAFQSSTPSPLFIQADPRNTGTPQWFAVVNDSSWGRIINYAGSFSHGISWFIPPGESSAVPFKNIVTTLMTNMGSLLQNSGPFNEDISSWDTSNATNMGGMFYGTTNFNQNISLWDTSKVTYMWGMFYAARAFNQNINGWNVANVTNMSETFAYTDEFNQPLSSWNVANVTDMSAMFQLARAFNQNISAWNVSKVRQMNWMFNLAGKFNNGGSPDIGNWDTSNVTSMDAMFNGKNNQITLSHPFNQPIGRWNTSKVTNMNYMFRNALAFNQDLSGWNVSLVTPKPPTEFSINVTNNSSVLSAAYNPNWQNLRNFSNLNKLTTDAPFELTAPLSNIPGLFTYSSSNPSVATISGTTVTIVGAGTTTITATQAASGNFLSRTISATLTVSPPPPLKLDSTTVRYVAGSSIEHCPTFIEMELREGQTELFAIVDNSSNARDQIRAYALSAGSAVSTYFTKLGESSPVPFNNIVTTLMTDMSGIFAHNYSFNKNISRWDTSNVETMSSMFNNATVFNQDISKWNTANVTNMIAMFPNARKFNQDIGSWVTSKVTNMYVMFQEAIVFNQNIGNWNTANVKNMNMTFRNAWAFNNGGSSQIGNWNTSNVEDMSYMFNSAYVFNQNIGNWNTAKVTTMEAMFASASAFNQNLSGWNVGKVTQRAAFANDSPLALPENSTKLPPFTQ